MSIGTAVPDVNAAPTAAGSPGKAGKHAAVRDPLPRLLLGLTVFTGVVDGISILALGRVFVANMTGNVVFVGFALVGAPGFSLAASLIGLGGFLTGARVGGRLIRWRGGDRGRLFATGCAAELLLVASTLAVIVAAGSASASARDVAVALLALATGIQNAVVRRLAVPDLTTTVLTMTLTGLASDRGGARSVPVRRVLAVFAMLSGAIIGAALVDHVNTTAALGAATALVLAVTIGAYRASRQPSTGPRSTSSRS